MKLVIIDYGLGNLNSLKSTFEYLNISDISVSNNFDEIIKANKLLLPGVGSFANAMTKIKNLKLETILKEQVILKKKPILSHINFSSS